MRTEMIMLIKELEKEQDEVVMEAKAAVLAENFLTNIFEQPVVETAVHAVKDVIDTAFYDADFTPFKLKLAELREVLE